MSESLLSVGIDLGTTTTQMVVSSLKVVNTAQPFSIPKLSISERTILYRSQAYFTPLRSAEILDTAAIRGLILAEYQKAGVRPEDVQTGAVIITGETARKENARMVLEDLSELAGEFVVATAGPALESILAARGAGADRYAASHGKRVLHLDIGGGTTNLALFDEEGKLLDTGCINVGGRLVKFSPEGTVTYVSPVLRPFGLIVEGEPATKEKLQNVVDFLIRVLQEAVGLRPSTELLKQFITDKAIVLSNDPVVLSFSGGVSDLIRNTQPDWRIYGDLGVLLGQAIGKSPLCAGDHVIGRETLQATVIGAGCHATELSGSTINYSNICFPLHNIPSVSVSEKDETASGKDLRQILDRQLRRMEQKPAALAFQGKSNPSYKEIAGLADDIAAVYANNRDPVLILLEQDMGKALGQALQCRLGNGRPILCLDGIHVPEDSYIDIGAPLENGGAIPVVVKTLAFL